MLNNRLKTLFTFLIGLLCYGQGEAYAATNAAPTAGLMEISQQLIATENTISLNVPWEFYWGKLLTSEDFAGSSAPKPDRYLSPAQKWSTDSIGAPTNRGVATYRLKVKTGAFRGPLALYIPAVRTSYRMWIDGRLIAKAGEVAMNKAEERPDSAHKIAHFSVDKDNVEIIFQVANFRHVEGGAGCNLLLVHAEDVGWQVIYYHLKDIFLIGSLTIVGACFFLFWLLRRKNPMSIYFAIYCLAGAIRPLVLEDGGLMHRFLSFLTWDQMRSIEYLTMTVGAASLLLIFFSLFPKDTFKPGFVVTLVANALYSLFIIFRPAEEFMSYLKLYHLSLLIGAVTLTHCLIKAIYNKRWGAKTLMVGFGLVFFALINDILLAQGVIYSVYLIPASTYVLIISLAIAIAQHALRAIEAARAEVIKLNASLEKQVIERTQTIQTIINNVKFGFLMIDKACAVQDGFTKSCREIFQKGLKIGDPLMDLLELSRRDSDHFMAAISQVFDDILPPHVALSNLPSHYNLNGRKIALEGAVIRAQGGDSDTGAVENVLFTVRDDTDLIKAEQEVVDNKIYMNLLRYKDAFRLFLIETRNDLSKLNGANTEPFTSEQKKILHTLKGNAGAFGLNELSSFIHALEENGRFAVGDIAKIESIIHAFLGKISDIIKFDLNKSIDEFYEITSTDLAALQTKIKKTNDANGIRHHFAKWLMVVRSKPASTLIGPMERTVEQLCLKQRKQAQVKITGGNLLLDPRQVDLLMKNLIHLVRNSVAHGIEPPDLRGEKPLIGTISIDFSEMNDTIFIRISDDGCGIAPERVIKQAVTVHIISPQQAQRMTTDEIIQLIFMEGVSTADVVTDIAGRGVGLSAIKDVVVQMGGTILVKSVPQQGTTFEISFPKTGTKADEEALQAA